jgi:outer membrane assembly lipoprotein YfiO
VRAILRPGPLRRIASLLCVAILAGCGASVMPTITSEADRLATARRMLDEKEYSTAAELLRGYIANNAGSGEVDQAIYLLGFAYLKTKEWPSATGEFERLLRDYPESDSSAAARFGLAEARFAQSRPPDYDQENTQQALDEWLRYLQDFPGHWQNAAARERIVACRTRLADKLIRTGRLYVKLNEWTPARVYFEKVANEYQDTMWVPEAEMGLALCDVHDGNRDAAIARFRDLEARYPGTPIAKRAERERKRLERT